VNFYDLCEYYSVTRLFGFTFSFWKKVINFRQWQRKVLKIVKNKRYVNVASHTLTFGGGILPFLPFAFFWAFERGLYIIKGG
jgi:hypothetical protein